MYPEPLVNVVLLTPEIPQNTGNVIRLCANVGARLHLVEPLGFRLDDRGLRRAALDYRDIADVITHPSIDSILESTPIDRVFGALIDGPVLYNAPRYSLGDTIVFGPESSGLSAPIVSRLCPENRVRIPMRPSNRSINLSNAVAIIVFEVWRQLGFAGTTINSLGKPPYYS